MTTNRCTGNGSRSLCAAHGNGQAAQLQLFDSPAALLQAVHMHGYAPDIAVLDIQMDEMTGH